MNLPNFPQPGEPILPWAGDITQAVRSFAPRSGLRTRVRQHGVGFSIETAKRPNPSLAPQPFQAYITGVATSTGGYSSITVKIREGIVFLSEDWDDVAGIDDLTTTAFTLDAVNECVWIEMHTIGDGAPEFTIGSGTPWTDYPAMYKYEPGESDTDEPQTWWYQILCRLRAPRTGEAPMKIGGADLILDQVVTSNLIVRDYCRADVGNLKQLHPWY